MADGAFVYENCLLKHHIRKNVWLPVCKERLNLLRSNDQSRQKRRLRYFTFCAVGAIDVLMLDVAKVIRPSNRQRFDTVCFFDRTQERVIETQKRIPGSIGFPGDFIKTVLLEDPDEDNFIDGNQSLSSPPNQIDDFTTRQRQLQLSIRRDFIRCFPFDVINLDLEEFLFKPNDPMPGNVINAMRKMFDWQKNKLGTSPGNSNKTIDGFSLMFTTQIGPPNISDDYLCMLQEYLIGNINNDRELHPIFVQRTGGVQEIPALRNSDFNLFFKLATPKVIAEALIEADWYIDPTKGIKIYEFERTSKNGSYKILHIVMDIKRQNPPRNRRRPQIQLSPDILDAHRQVIHNHFQYPETIITEETIDKEDLKRDLSLIFSRREKYLKNSLPGTIEIE